MNIRSSCSLLSPHFSICLLLLLFWMGITAPPWRTFAATRNGAAAEADLAVIKSGDETAQVGGTITYSLVVSNGGPDAASNVRLSDSIPEHTTFVSATSSSGSVAFANNTVTADLGTINAFESASVTLVVSVNGDTARGTTISNTAGVTSDTPDPDETNNSSTALTNVTGPFSGDLLISEFRLRGPNGASDEYIEVYNNSESPHTVSASDASAGYAIAASDGVVRCTIPNGTLLPVRGHFLCVNSAGYSLAGYPASDSTTATGDATYTTDIPDNIGVAIFRTANPVNFTLVNRLDAVGSAAETNQLYREGNGYPELTPLLIDYAFYRDTCGKAGSVTKLGVCPSKGLPQDTDDNAADFVFVDTNMSNAGAGQRLGAPGPENLSSPVQRNIQFESSNLDTTKATSQPPNRVRDFTSDPANNSTFGTLDIRRRVTNGTGLPVTRLRFRIIDMTTFPAPSGFADLRALTSSAIVVSGVEDAATCAPAETLPCAVTVQGTTLEQPPAQPNGGGFNSSLAAGTVTLQTPLAPGESINVRFLLGIQQTGVFKFFVNIEALNAEPGEETLAPLRLRARAVKSR